MNTASLVRLSCLVVLMLAGPVLAVDLTTWHRDPELKTGTVQPGQATLSSQPWAFLRTADDHADGQVEVRCTLLETAKQFGFFGSSWSVWPQPTFPDQGYEIGVLVRAGEKAGYRVQLSHRYQDVALVRYPEGGYLRVASCKVVTGRPHSLNVQFQGNQVIVAVDGQEKIRYLDPLTPLPRGKVALGVSSGARVRFEGVALQSLPPGARTDPPAHVPNLSMRRWLGGRPWVFDGDEPILLLPVPEASSINNVKLRPGLRPLLSWNSHWDIANQGAFREGTNTNSPVKVTGSGRTLTATWSARQTKGRFVTRTAMSVGFDPRRQAYTYDVDSTLEVQPGEPFHFRYGYDFEHHTPLDPFRWQYLILRRKGGALAHRPVYPVDPGPQNDLETNRGLRVWYGRHGEKMTLAPAVEYHITDAGKRQLNTAVCAAFYDTGVSFAPETAPAGTKVRVRYRYTGYPAAEAEALFKESTIYPSATLDPEHHYLFADDWPRVTFRNFRRLSETWILGRRPFMTGHNQRPSYELARDTGEGNGFAMKLGPGAYGAVNLATPKDLPGGRYALTARMRSDNAHGPGGRIELTIHAPKTGKELARHTHFPGNGTWAWKTTGFVFDVPQKGCSLRLGLGNAGTGDVTVGEVAFQRLETATLPPGVLARPQEAPAVPAALEGALADYRMEEGKGLHVLDHAAGPFGMLELSSVDWTRDEGRPALRFHDADSPTRRFPRYGTLHQSYLMHPGYRGKDTVPAALAGHHGGGRPLEAFTLSAWIKPAVRMGTSTHGGKGDIVGLGARRVIMRLLGDRAPYRLAAALDVNDVFQAPTLVAADRWCHVAVTGEPVGTDWLVRLYLDGKKVHEGRTRKMKAPTRIPPSLVLGTEIFYFHDAYYRGLIGRTLVFGRSLALEEVARLASQ